MTSRLCPTLAYQAVAAWRRSRYPDRWVAICGRQRLSDYVFASAGHIAIALDPVGQMSAVHAKRQQIIGKGVLVIRAGIDSLEHATDAIKLISIANEVCFRLGLAHRAIIKRGGEAGGDRPM